MTRLYRALEALIHGGKIVLTGTGIEHRGGKITVTGTGVVREWALVSEQYPWLKFWDGTWLCDCPTYGVGYVRVPQPYYPQKNWFAVWDGAILTVTWRPYWDFNDDGRVNLSDLAHFAVEYVKGKWTLADFAKFADLYNHTGVYSWWYKRA